MLAGIAYRRFLSATAMIGMLAALNLQGGMTRAEMPASAKLETPKIVPRGTYRIKLELTAEGRISIFVQDKNGKKVSTEGYSATLVILRGSVRQGPYRLVPAGDNKLEAWTKDWLGPGGVRVVTLWTPDGKTAQWRYASPDSEAARTLTH